MAYTASITMWTFAFSLYIGVSKCYFSVPLKIYTGKYNLSSDVGLTPVQRVVLTSDGNGLSLASDPTGTVNFLDMVNNLEGDSGRGYYIEMSIGTPGQKVMLLLLCVCVLIWFDSCYHFYKRFSKGSGSHGVTCYCHSLMAGLVYLLCVNRGRSVHHVAWVCLSLSKMWCLHIQSVTTLH